MRLGFAFFIALTLTSLTYTFVFLVRLVVRGGLVAESWDLTVGAGLAPVVKLLSY